MRPFSRSYGYGRGTPVDRVYLDRFLRSRSDSIRGVVLEVQRDHYASSFGGAKVDRVEVLDVDPRNEHATIVGDLADPTTLRESAFDTIICTQTLYLLSDPFSGCENLWNSLRPGGSLLLSTPCICPVDDGSGPDQWRVTPAGLREIIERTMPSATALDITGHGNLTVAAAFLYGLAAEDLDPADFEVRDAAYPVIVTAYVEKASLLTDLAIPAPSRTRPASRQPSGPR